MRRMTIHGTRGLLAAVGALGLLLIGAAPARAASPAPSQQAAPACWGDVTTGRSLCVDAGTDLIPAVAAEYGVQLIVPSNAIIGGRPVGDVASTSLAPDTALTSTVVSIVYADTGYGGASYVLSESTTTAGCSTGWAFGFTSMPSGWNDRVSSFRSYAGCSTAIFENTNYGGLQYGYYTSASSVGGMNDRASSWRAA